LYAGGTETRCSYRNHMKKPTGGGEPHHRNNSGKNGQGLTDEDRRDISPWLLEGGGRVEKKQVANLTKKKFC